ncbi:hypothetical protein Tco_0932335 [Tanacetum coccineum]
MINCNSFSITVKAICTTHTKKKLYDHLFKCHQQKTADEYDFTRHDSSKVLLQHNSQEEQEAIENCGTEDEITDEVFELRRRVKGKNVEETRISPIPSPTRSPRNLSTLGRYGYLFAHLKKTWFTLPRTSSDQLADNLHDVMMETLPSLVKEKVTEQVKKEVPAQVRDQVPVYLAEGLILERKTTKEETERLISKAILQERGRMQAQISSQIQNAIDNAIPSLVCDSSERSLYARFQTNQLTQDIMEEISLTIDEAKLKKMADEMLRQICTSGDEHQYHIDQMKNFLQSDIVWESRKEILVSPHLRKITPLVQSCPEKIVLSLHKFLAIVFNDDDIEERTSRWVNKCIKKFNPYARYGVEN